MSVKVNQENAAEGAATEVTEQVVDSSQKDAGGSAQGASGSEATEGTSEKSPSPGEKAEGEEGEPAAAAAPAYQPKTKIKVMKFGSKDEQVEHDVPAFLVPLMKDEASEKEVLSLLNKAFGLEPVMQARAKAQQERDQVRGEFTKLSSGIQDLRATYQRGDMDLFFDKLQIPHERVLQWALDRVNYSQLPPDQQRIHDERREAQRRAHTAEQQMGTQEQRLLEQERQTRMTLLDHGLTRPDVSTFAQAYDARINKPGAFRDEVIAQGELAWLQSQGTEILSPEQAIERAMQKWNGFLTPPAAAQQGSAQAQAAAAPAKPAGTIPNVPGKGSASPMKPQVKSIEDLKKLRDQANKTA